MNAWSREVSPPKPMLTVTMLAATVLVPPLMLFQQYSRWWTPLQKQYALTYLLTARAGTGRYRLLKISYSKASAMAIDSDVVPAAPSMGVPPQLTVPFVLSDQAKRAGAKSLDWESFPNVDNTELHEWLRKDVYDGQSLWELLKVPLEQCALFLLVLLPLAISADWKRRRQLQQGRFVRGSQFVSRSQFNRAKRCDGIGFETSPLSFWEHFRGFRPEVFRVRIPKDEESKHILLMGDSGNDKASLIRQILIQLRTRGDTAIVFDPTLAFTPQFYDPARGDRILNPADQRMPYWTPCDEVRYVPEALVLVESLSPKQPTEDLFCVQVARRIFDQLLRFRPSPQELAHWLSRWEQVDRHVAGTEVATVLERATTSQRASVQFAFSRVAAALKLLPVEDQGQARWSAAEWVRERQGWLFLTSYAWSWALTDESRLRRFTGRKRRRYSRNPRRRFSCRPVSHTRRSGLARPWEKWRSSGSKNVTPPACRLSLRANGKGKPTASSAGSSSWCCPRRSPASATTADISSWKILS